MIIENLTTLKINKLTKAQYEAAAAAGTLNNNELYMTEDPNVDLSDVALKPTITTATLLASNWDSTAKTYSFETTYPSARYDIEVEINGDSCTDEQLEAWIAAKPVSSLKNKINAKGDVPSVDIPIILTVIPNEKPISLISFTIGPTSYQAEEGMTWGDWIESGYNTDGFYFDTSNNRIQKATTSIVADPIDGYPDSTTITIVADRIYYLTATPNDPIA